MKRPPWTPAENATLLRIEAAGMLTKANVAALLEALPGRTYEACMSRMQGLRAGEGRSTYHQERHPTPKPPRGMTAEQVDWARANAGHPEARMILGFAEERA